MKTIKELSDICACSKTTIYRVIKELNIETELSGNKNIITDTDAERIVLVLRGFGLNENSDNPNQSNDSPNQSKTEQDNKTPSETVADENTVISKNSDFLVNFLMEQIKEKDKQIQNLQNENNMLIQAQAYTLKQLELLSAPEPKEEVEEPETIPEPAINPNNAPETETIDNSAGTNKKWWQFWK